MKIIKNNKKIIVIIYRDQDWIEGPLEFIPYTRTGAVRGLELANYKRAYDFILNQALLLQAYINSGGGITEEEDW